MKNPSLLIGAALLVWTTAAQSAPIYTSRLGFCGAGLSVQTVSSTPTTLSESRTCSNINTLVATATSFAGPGALGVSASVSNDFGLGAAAAGVAFAEMQSTFVITGPVGGPSSIAVSLNLDLSGFTSTFSCCDGSGWFLNLNTRQFGQGSVRSNLAGTGLLAAIPSEGSIIVDTTITTPAVTFAVGPAHILEISLSVAANANRIGNAEIDFAHTLSFPTNGPVFNLPDGYRIDAPDLGIVNNRFVVDESVPEPASIALTAGALIAAGLLRRRRQKTGINMNKQILIAGVPLLALSSAAQAAPVFSAALGLNHNCASNIPVATSSASIVMSDDWSCGSNLFASGTALVGPGIMGVSAKASNFNGQGNATFSSANAHFQDIFIITGPAGGPSSILVSMNLHISGFTALTGESAWSMSLASTIFGSGALSSLTAGTGLLAGLPFGDDIAINSSITTPTVRLAVGTTVLLDLGWIVRASASRIGTAEIDFANTLTFPASGPVFNLPDGYTIDAPGLGIVNNRFVAERSGTIVDGVDDCGAARRSPAMAETASD